MNTVKLNDMDLPVQAFIKKTVAIVRFGPAGFITDGMNAGEFFQVTIDPQKISPSGEFVRFGDSPGDEIMGWQKCKAITVCEVLGEWDGEDSPILEYGKQNKVEMLLPLEKEKA